MYVFVFVFVFVIGATDVYVNLSVPRRHYTTAAVAAAAACLYLCVRSYVNNDLNMLKYLYMPSMLSTHTRISFVCE